MYEFINLKPSPGAIKKHVFCGFHISSPHSQIESSLILSLAKSTKVYEWFSLKEQIV